MGKRTVHPLSTSGTWKKAQEIITIMGGDPGQLTGCRYDRRSNNFNININNQPAITVNAEMKARRYGSRDMFDVSGVIEDRWDMIAEAQGNDPRARNPSGLLNLFGL